MRVCAPRLIARCVGNRLLESDSNHEFQFDEWCGAPPRSPPASDLDPPVGTHLLFHINSLRRMAPDLAKVESALAVTYPKADTTHATAADIEPPDYPVQVMNPVYPTIARTAVVFN